MKRLWMYRVHFRDKRGVRYWDTPAYDGTMARQKFFKMLRRDGHGWCDVISEEILRPAPDGAKPNFVGYLRS